MEWLGKQDKPPLLIMDEAHRAAGEGSNVGLSMTALVEGVKAAGGSVAYASGTALKGARNLRVYGSALPDVGIPPDRLVELIEKEPLALQEALSYEMARSEGLLRVNSTTLKSLAKLFLCKMSIRFALLRYSKRSIFSRTRCPSCWPSAARSKIGLSIGKRS
ncbi:hypothetical protein G3A56_27670 (plasmid) [Rhizobium oryzihabitans]|uniref:Uncharacterized protein n=1 Tax=Rhizobium oryzihabitans TaxID=2267833 RepID=A0A7L5BS95_9HYPH|nr:hypothetical protein [Rhizobium oryzihabitans]QIB41576.1 hypothetical protein G3A56_27670 [Rhizobium oryzihabitans]